jgi:hypothetical protein
LALGDMSGKGVIESGPDDRIEWASAAYPRVDPIAPQPAIFASCWGVVLIDASEADTAPLGWIKVKDITRPRARGC